MQKIESLLFTRLGGQVTRFHTLRTIRETNVAEHSFGVANLVIYLTRGNASANLLKAALHHDVAEAELGDVPAPVKRRVPEVKDAYEQIERELNEEHNLVHELRDEEHRILKFADSMDMIFYSMEEILSGNRRFIVIMERAYGYCKEVFIEDYEPMKVLLQYARRWYKENVDLGSL